MRSSTSSRRREESIQPIHYVPPDGYALDLEIIPIQEIRRRALGVDLSRPERIDFHLFFVVSSGRFQHMVDFESHPCGPGSVLLLQPGQVQRYDDRFPWDGWLLLFRPELLQPGTASALTGDLDLAHRVETLPVHLRVKRAERESLLLTLDRMTRDASLPAPAPTINTLLRLQLHTLLLRLLIAGDEAHPQSATTSPLQKHFLRYRREVDRSHTRWHHVAQYANHLGYSERTLNRATLASAGTTAKQFLTRRIVLEAKRMLAHTTLPVATIGNRLGFDEATNFVKFFRREAGQTPGEFRIRHCS